MTKLKANREDKKQQATVQRNTNTSAASRQQKTGAVSPANSQSGHAPIQAKQSTVPAKNRPVVKFGGHDRTEDKREETSPDGPVQRKEQDDPPWYERAWNATTSAVGTAAGYVSDKAGDAYDYVNDKAEQGSIYLLDKVLPVGMGVAVQLDGGITWGIPLYTGGSATCYIKRADKNTVNLLVRKQGTLALDTGVGASAMMGGAKRGNRPAAGIGAEAGANVQAGVQGTNIEEYNIPVPKFLSFVGKSALTTMLSTNAMMTPLNNLMSQHADQYRTRQRFEFGIFAQADAEAGVGVRRASDNFQDKAGPGGTRHGRSSWGPDGDRDFQGSKPKMLEGDPLALLNFLGIFGSAQIRGQVGGGVEQQRQGKKTITSLYMEGEVSAMIGLPIPMLNQILQMLPNGVGAGAELTFTQEPGKKTQTHLKVYQKQGEDQVYAGSANQQSFNINLTNLLSVDQIVQGLKSGKAPVTIASMKQAFEKVSFFNRILLSGGTTGMLRKFLRKQQGTRSLLSDQTKKMSQNAGASYDVYLDLGAEMSGPDFMKIVQKVLKVGSRAIDATKDAKGIAQTYKALQDFINGYAESPELTALIDDVLDGFIIDKAVLRVQGSLGFGISGKLSAGAKVRGDLSAQGGLFSEVDYVQAMGQGGRMNLRHLIESLPQVMNDPVKYFPGSPLIKAIYGG